MIETRQIEQFFESRYNDPSRFAYFSELYLGERRVDGLLMWLQKSKNYQITAFEFKTSRSDFLSELNNPIKRQEAIKLSNYFVFVTANDIVKSSDEIPEGCGWSVFDGEKLIPKTEPVFRTKVEAAPWPLLAAVMRRAFKVRDTHSKVIREYLRASEALSGLDGRGTSNRLS